MALQFLSPVRNLRNQPYCMPISEERWCSKLLTIEHHQSMCPHGIVSVADCIGGLQNVPGTFQREYFIYWRDHSAHWNTPNIMPQSILSVQHSMWQRFRSNFHQLVPRLFCVVCFLPLVFRRSNVNHYLQLELRCIPPSWRQRLARETTLPSWVLEVALVICTFSTQFLMTGNSVSDNCISHRGVQIAAKKGLKVIAIDRYVIFQAEHFLSPL